MIELLTNSANCNGLITRVRAQFEEAQNTMAAIASQVLDIATAQQNAGKPMAISADFPESRFNESTDKPEGWGRLTITHLECGDSGYQPVQVLDIIPFDPFPNAPLMLKDKTLTLYFEVNSKGISWSAENDWYNHYALPAPESLEQLSLR